MYCDLSTLKALSVPIWCGQRASKGEKKPKSMQMDNRKRKTRIILAAQQHHSGNQEASSDFPMCKEFPNQVSNPTVAPDRHSTVNTSTTRRLAAAGTTGHHPHRPAPEPSPFPPIDTFFLTRPSSTRWRSTGLCLPKGTGHSAQRRGGRKRWHSRISE